MTKTFDHLLILGRPAAGKSEFIDFMKKTPDAERAKIFHIGRFEEIDDFPWLWEKFVEDDMWEEAGHPRVFSSKNGANYDVRPDRICLYKFMFAKFNQAIAERYLSNPKFYDEGTLLIEFSRGSDNTYMDAFTRLSPELLKKSAILYIKVDFEESWRRNVARYQEKLRDSILAHMIPRSAMEHFYLTEDWDDITSSRESGTLSFHGVDVPFFTMDNTPELKEYDALAKRYEPALTKLFDIYGNGK